MDKPEHDPILSSALLAEIEAIAASENKSSREVLQEAVVRFLRDRRPPADAEPVKALEAAARMLASRPQHRLPEGETIRSLMTYGRM